MSEPGTSGATGRIVQVSVGAGGVPKYAVTGPAWVGLLGVEGDRHTGSMHGGPDGAVCLYATESIDRVRADGHQAFPGAYGENLTTAGIEIGLLEAGTCLQIGDGGLVIQLTGYASPCSTLEPFFEGGRIARVSQKVHPEDARQYARVLSEGPVTAGDTVAVLPPAE